MKRVILVLLAVFWLAAGPPKQPKIVSINAANPVEVNSGASIDYPLELIILKGFHIQANPASGKYLIPLTVKLEQTFGVQPGTLRYPTGLPFRLKGSDRDISTYEGKVSVTIPIKADQTVKPGDIVLKGTVRYQGCDDELCFPPVTLPLELKLKVQ